VVDPLATWKVALAAAKASTTAAVVNCIGDSVTAGDWGGTTANAWLNNSRGGSWPFQTQALFEANGFSYGGSNWFGSENSSGGAYSLVNTECNSIGSSAPLSTVLSLGGPLFRDTSGATSFKWTPYGNVDTLTFYYPTNTTLGTISVGRDGTGIFDTINPAVSPGFASKTYTQPLGAIQWAVVRASGSGYFIGMESYNSANKKAVRLRNYGWGGSSTVDWTTSSSPAGFGAIDALPSMKADLHIVMLAINDWQAAVPLATYQANLRTIIAAAKTQGGSVMLVAPNRTDTALTPALTQQSYVDAMQAVAVADGYDFFDVASISQLADYATANANGLMGDQRHPKRTGYALIAAAIYARINP
jgi:lysophospholipase L1-like esterase